MKRFAPWLAWLPAVLYMAVIWVVSSMPLHIDLGPVPFRDKGVHFLVYGVLAILLNYAFFGTLTRGHARATAFYGTLCTILWGLLDEIHQAYVPGRMSDPLDALADTVGAVLGSALFMMVIYLRPDSRSRSATGRHSSPSSRPRVDSQQ